MAVRTKKRRSSRRDSGTADLGGEVEGRGKDHLGPADADREGG